jgi:hypothetical protein
MEKNCKVAFTLVALIVSVIATFNSYAQVSLDIDIETARRAASKTFVDDLSVNDNAYIYQNFRIKDDALYVRLDGTD